MPGGADRIVLARIERQHLFEPDVVLPEVAQVVLVEEPLALAQLEVGKRT